MNKEITNEPSDDRERLFTDWEMMSNRQRALIDLTLGKRLPLSAEEELLLQQIREIQQHGGQINLPLE